MVEAEELVEDCSRGTVKKGNTGGGAAARTVPAAEEDGTMKTA